MLCCQCGCVASKRTRQERHAARTASQYRLPAFTAAAVDTRYPHRYGGPGSWKREALWDEYVLTLENHGERPLTIDSATLADPAGTSYAAGSDPWALEKQSKKLEKQYRDHGEAFIRAAGPGVVIVGVGAATASAAAAGGPALISAGAAGRPLATVFVLPVYYLTVLGINHHNKKAVMTEFKRRRLPLALTLAPGRDSDRQFVLPDGAKSRLTNALLVERTR